jgi:polyhydroxyalkanoate synthesis regulator phasin
MDILEEFKAYEAESPEDVSYMAHHKIDVLVELLVAKGLISKEELKAKMDELAVVDEVSDEEEID